MSSIHWLHLNWIDYSIIALILISVLIGLVRGFVCEVISLITWIAAFVLAFKFSAKLAAHLTFTHSATTSYVLAFAGIVIVTLVIGITINVLVQHAWRRTGVPVMDRVLGFLLGIARGVFIIAFVLLLLKVSPLQNDPTVKSAQLIPLFNPVVKWLNEILPEKVTHIAAWPNNKKQSDNSAEKK